MLDPENYMDMVFKFNDRQAGISCIYSDETKSFSYNAYCLETKLLKELFSAEFSYLTDALELVNDEFGTWALVRLDGKSDCGTCAAK